MYFYFAYLISANGDWSKSRALGAGRDVKWPHWTRFFRGANGHWMTSMRAGLMNIAETTSSANVTRRREDCDTATHASDFDFPN
jgi:hypothetical protein